MKKSALLIALISLGGCSIFEGDKEEIIFDDVLGPNTKALSKAMPQDLRGDTDNRAYSGSKVGANLEKEDPDGTR